MDNTTLISSSIDGLTHMLNIANEFYKMNNTKINFTKADLITNRDPSSLTSPAVVRPAPFHFNLVNNSFTITPLPPSFRFLGVWFSLSNNMQFIKKQCHVEYQLFANKLARKLLTIRQLTYLHNSVLLPKVEYRLMCSLLAKSLCKIISAPMRKIIKHAGKFSYFLPSSFVHYEYGLNMTDLYLCNVQNHNSPTLRRIYYHRLQNLHNSLWTLLHPFFITDFSV